MKPWIITIYPHAGVTRGPSAGFCRFVMTTILDDQLYSHSDRLAGKVVLITGGCSTLNVTLGIYVPRYIGVIGVHRPVIS